MYVFSLMVTTNHGKSVPSRDDEHTTLQLLLFINLSPNKPSAIMKNSTQKD